MAIYGCSCYHHIQPLPMSHPLFFFFDHLQYNGKQFATICWKTHTIHHACVQEVSVHIIAD